DAVDMHGDLSQRNRERNLARFSKGEASVIVATDVAARGIHVDGIGLVVHYDAPAEHKAYMHRSGRTARAGESGSVVTMTTPEALRDVMMLQNKAGVTARHHRAATAPSPMTAASLTTSGTEAPALAAGRSGGGGNSGGRSGGHRGGRPQGNRSGGNGRGGASNPNRNRNRSRNSR
ncbi:MAG: C-terminal helicase domain-containing protein, partial [Aeromicrobium sp.]|uniref:helicase-related protein n=1 Tax=Aeromicrobium sp. TaxID=1871063 RepID=UPI003C3EB624